MRHVWKNPSKGFVQWGLVLILAISTGLFFVSDVSRAQSDPVRSTYRLPIVGTFPISAGPGGCHNSYHSGASNEAIDFPMQQGTPVYAIADGIVRHARWSKGGYGWLVKIEHANGDVSFYAHSWTYDGLGAILVAEQATVRRGDILAFSGNSGNSTGPHLHFEVQDKDGKAVNVRNMPGITWYSNDVSNVCDRAGTLGTASGSPVQVPLNTNCPQYWNNNLQGITLFTEANCLGSSLHFESPGLYKLGDHGFDNSALSVYVNNRSMTATQIPWSVRLYETIQESTSPSRCLMNDFWDLNKDWYTNSAVNIGRTVSMIRLYHNNDCSGSATDSELGGVGGSWSTPVQEIDQQLRNCQDINPLAASLSYLFSAVNCNGDITWFSGHPENGPSANSASLYVPSNSVVKVSSQDNGAGETACFTSTQTDLGAWRNKIQWAQLVPGGSCPVVTADGYVIHTNQGDFRVNNGQTWDNTQHNRQIWGFDRQGSVHLKINHVNGAQRCWDESKTAQQLQNDGDWWIQTRSIEIGSGYCPGMSGQLEVYSLANFQGGRHDIRAGNLRTYPDNDLKYSLRFTQPGMSVKLTNAAGRTRCWNTNIANLQDHEDYWNRTTKIEVFGSDVCPKPVEVPTGATFAPGSNVKYTYYEYIAPMVGLPIPNVWTPVSTGYAGNFAINQVPHRDNDFAIRFESCLTVPSTGSYTFYTTSDDGSKLYINGQNIVDNDGYHSSSEKSGTVNLTAGIHSIAVDFFEGGVDQMLGVAWQGPNFAKQWMPNQQLAMTGCSWELKKQLPTIKPDMFAIVKSGLTAGTTGVKLLTGSSNFSTVQGTFPTYIEEDTRQNYAWAYELADYNFDGTLDVYAFKKTGTGSGMTELHILNGASNYRSFALQTPTTLGATGYDYVWDFELGDYDKDGRLDAFAINKKYTGQRKVELHILKGAGNFQTWCAHIVTALPELSNLDYWDFELADYDGDKNLDLFAFNKTGTASGKIELSILKGPTFSSIAVQQQLPIGTIFSATNRQLELADYSGDGVQDLYVVDSVGNTGVVEVMVWDGNGLFQNKLASLLTAQPNVSDGGTRWLFRFARLKGQILGASLSDGAGETLHDTVAPVDNVPVNLLFLPLISN